MRKSLADHDNPTERILALKSAAVTPDQLRAALQDPNPQVREFAAHHPALPQDVVQGDVSDLPVDTQNCVEDRPDYASVQEAGWANPDANMVDADPWVQAKYRRGGHQTFERYLKELQAGLHKALDFETLTNRPIASPLLYRAYKHSPHHPISLLLKYVVNRIENKDIYEHGNPAQIAQHEQSWLQHHTNEKNANVGVEDLHQALKANPKLIENVQSHQTKLHDYIKQHNPDAIRNINGQPHIALARGYTVRNPGADHDVASYADDANTAGSFGGTVKHWWVPMKNVWYSYHVGHKTAGGLLGPENEFLASNHPRIPANVPDVRPVVPREHYGYATPSEDWELEHTPDVGRLGMLASQPSTGKEIQSHLAALKNKRVTPELLQHQVYSHSPDIRSAVAAHPNATPAQIHAGLKDPDNFVALEAVSRKDLTPEHLTAAMKHPSALVRKLALSDPRANHSHFKMGLADPDESVRKVAEQQKVAFAKPKIHPIEPSEPEVTSHPAVVVGDKHTPKSYAEHLIAKHGWRQTSEGLQKSIGYVVYPHFGVPSPYSEPMARTPEQHAAFRQANTGTTNPNSGGFVAYHAKADRPTPPAERGFSSSYSTDAKFNSIEHETQHSVYSVLKQMHGKEAGRRIVEKTLEGLTPDERGHLHAITDPAVKNYPEKKASEERITYLHNYTSDPTFRKAVHVKMGIAGNLKAQHLSVQHAKKIAQHLQSIAADMKPEHVGLSDVQKSESVINELGFGVQQDLYLNAVSDLCQIECDGDLFRLEVAKNDDLATSTLVSAHLPPLVEYQIALDEQARISSVALVLCKSDMEVQNVLPEGQTTAEAVKRAFEANQVEEVQLGGKHSKGTMVAEDPDGAHFLLKPGSGKLSPAAGVREEVATQARRECAFWHVARNWGLGQFIPRADLISLNGKEIAALHRLPWDWQNLDKLAKKDPQAPVKALEPYLKNGDLHKWAVIDAVLGQTDRHGANIMVSPDEDGCKIALIDQGSALAGPSFAPGTDPKSFIPYYLRVWRAKDWKDMDLEQKLKAMPEVHGDNEEHLRQWALGLRTEDLESILVRYGVTPQASLARLAQFKQMALAPDFCVAINRWWLET